MRAQITIIIRKSIPAVEEKKLPALAPQLALERPLSIWEYYFASVGRSASSQEMDCDIITVIEGESRVTFAQWEAALAQVVAANAACRVRIAGRRRRACWRSDGIPTRIRQVDNCTWDGRSDAGLEFLKTPRLDLENGPASELIVVTGNPARLVLRVHHAVMDGLGTIYFFQELFRALRGEPLLGTNAAFSDADLMQSVSSQPQPKLSGKPAYLTGALSGAGRHGVWRRITVEDVPASFLLGRLAVYVARFARRYSEQPTWVLLPVNLRRHLPGLNSMMNFTSLILVDLGPDDGPNDFYRKLQKLLKDNADAYYTPALDYFKWLPMAWLDWVASKLARHDKAKDTAAISNFGMVSKAELSSDGFAAHTLFALPAFHGNSFLVMTAMGNTTEITVGMPRALASDGRLEAFTAYLEAQLAQ